MAPNDHGGFSCAVNVVPGQRYRYRFLLDGDRWINDVAAHDYVPNEFGGEDSVLDLSAQADHELAAARERQTADTVEPLGGERPDDGLAPLVNNTGDDGGAATG
jgi:hypothetical protein